MCEGLVGAAPSSKAAVELMKNHGSILLQNICGLKIVWFSGSRFPVKPVGMTDGFWWSRRFNYGRSAPMFWGGSALFLVSELKSSDFLGARIQTSRRTFFSGNTKIGIGCWNKFQRNKHEKSRISLLFLSPFFLSFFYKRKKNNIFLVTLFFFISFRPKTINFLVLLFQLNAPTNFLTFCQS